LCADVEEDLPACSVDGDQIEQALGELIENAVHHTPAGGRVTVEAKASAPEEGGGVQITVMDTGPGVPDKDKERIFTPFISARPGGSGLGLAIVRQIVENHGGTIRETGTAGEGARFEIVLPEETSEETPA
jgi:signal transduction histidine kinase